MDLIYYYPLSEGAPASVGRNVFTHFQERKKELPFENLKLFVASKYAKEVQKQFSDLEVLTYKNLNSILKR